MKNRGYIVIQDWMLDLPLSLVETVVYAIIYGFSQDEDSAFSGSLAYIARKSKVSKDTARRALNKLVDEGYIQRIVVSKNGVSFNDYKTCTMQGEVANCNGGSSKLQPHNKEHNKDINICINKARQFSVPSLSEVQAYCRERGNSVNAEAFMAFYESNGWMVGKNKMKDWKAAVRTWEQRRQATPSAARPARQESAYEHNQRLMRELLGGKYDGGPIDEQ